MVKINLNIEIKNGRVTLKGKTYNELNDDEKIVMDELLKDHKTETA